MSLWLDLMSVSRTVRPVSARVRRACSSVSDDVRRKGRIVLRRAAHNCAPLHLVWFDRDEHSVSAHAVGQPVDVHTYADRIVICQDGVVVAEHQCSFGQGRII